MIYNPEIFASGIYGVCKVFWTLRCETPLVIRNGKSITYKTNDNKKTRGMGIWFDWKQPLPDTTSEHSVATLHYGYRVQDNRLERFHFVPPSSIRGSLRSWTINHLVEPIYRGKMSPPPRENEGETQVYLQNLKAALSDAHSGYARIASLFGLAFESRQDNENELSNAGRFRIETRPFDTAAPKPISVDGKLQNGLVGPTNAQRQMTVRNPLDRVTHASKKGGLHQFLEFSRGEIFDVEITILNPQDSDLGLLGLWRRELNYGMLRLGALSSIGRGRVSISKEEYTIWLGPGAPTFEGIEPSNDDSFSEDALVGLWRKYTIVPDALSDFASSLQEYEAHYAQP